MMYQTFSLIIDYLAYSGKILIDSDNKIYWSFNEAKDQLKYKPRPRKAQKKEIKEEKSSILNELIAQEAQENQQIHEHITYIG